MLHGNGPYFTRPWGGTIIARRLQRILLDPHEAKKILSALNNLQMGVLEGSATYHHKAGGHFHYANTTHTKHRGRPWYGSTPDSTAAGGFHQTVP
jgi:hypothetical protein